MLTFGGKDISFGKGFSTYDIAQSTAMAAIELHSGYTIHLIRSSYDAVTEKSARQDGSEKITFRDIMALRYAYYSRIYTVPGIRARHTGRHARPTPLPGLYGLYAQARKSVRLV